MLRYRYSTHVVDFCLMKCHYSLKPCFTLRAFNGLRFDDIFL